MENSRLEELIFVVDDEPHILHLLDFGLQEHGFRVRVFSNGASFSSAMKTERPDAVVLDWMMPPPDGEELTRQLRQDPRTRPIPIILLTARGAEKDRIQGLEFGADDYVVKPFSIKELATRLRSVLRRDAYLKDYRRLRHGDLELDEDARQIFQNGGEIPLTQREFDLLCLLMKNAGRTLTREYLVDTVWGLDYEGDMRTLDVHIRYLRKKLEQNQKNYIQTVRGVGYRFFTEGEGV